MLTGKVPEPRAVSLALSYVMHYADTHVDGWANRRITRVHFHSLAFHIIAIRLNSNSRHWTTMMDSAVAQGAVTAATKACGMDLKSFKSEHIEAAFHAAKASDQSRGKRFRKESTILNPDKLVKTSYRQLAFDMGMPVVGPAIEHQMGVIELGE